MAEALLWAVRAGYALLIALMVWRKTIWQWPAFWLFLWAASLKAALWDPNNVPRVSATDMLFLALLAVAVLEAYLYTAEFIPQRETRILLVVMGLVALLAVVLTLNFYERDILQVRYSARLAIGIACAVGFLHFALYPPQMIAPGVRRHAAILCVYCWLYVVTNSVYPRDIEAWQRWHSGHLIGVVSLQALWLLSLREGSKRS